MLKCGDCDYAEDPSPTIIRCRIRGIYKYIDEPACHQIKLHDSEVLVKKSSKNCTRKNS